MADTKIPADIAKMSFEDALAELEEIVSGLEDGTAKLDESIKAYERGALLKKHCEDKLKEAKAKVEKINVAADGTVTTEPMDAE